MRPSGNEIAKGTRRTHERSLGQVRVRSDGPEGEQALYFPWLKYATVSLSISFSPAAIAPRRYIAECINIEINYAVTVNVQCVPVVAMRQYA